MHRALALPEILQIVFQILTENHGALAACTRVHRSWFHLAIGELWQEVAGKQFDYLLDMLGPREMRSDGWVRMLNKGLSRSMY
jgi:hypothetical protein